MINNIDVTLRDGGYQNGFHFPTDYAIKHVQARWKAALSGLK